MRPGGRFIVPEGGFVATAKNQFFASEGNRRKSKSGQNNNDGNVTKISE